jgi:hypothetical protein
LPTLADIAGIELKGTKKLDGISLKPLLLGAEPQWPDRTFYHYKGGKLSVRTQRYRLDGDGNLFDMHEDPGQKSPINQKSPALTKQLQQKADDWMKNVLAKYKKTDERPFIIGHPDTLMTQIPARDGKNRGGIQRSTKYPNDSYFTNWKQLDDAIIWNCEVGKTGTYKVEVFYTCPKDSVGSTVELSFNSSKLVGKITVAHDPPLLGMERDRVKRKESYNKDFKRMTLGEIQLSKGKGELIFKALNIPGSQVMDLRTLLITRVK